MSRAHLSLLPPVLGVAIFLIVATIGPLATTTHAQEAITSSGSDSASLGAPLVADDDSGAPAAPPDVSPSSGTGWLSAMWGRAAPDGIIYLPIGVHGNSTQPRDFELIGGIYKSLTGGTFINSRGYRTWFVGFERSLFQIKQLRFGYRVGAMIGYHGSLANSKRVPLAHSVLFEHNVNPAFGVPARIDLVKHVQAEVFITPLVVVGGVRLVFGDTRREP